MEKIEITLARIEEKLSSLEKHSDEKFKSLFELFNNKITPAISQTQANSESIAWLKWGVMLLIGAFVSGGIAIAMKLK